MESDNYETSSPSSMCSSEDELHHAYSMTDMLDELNEHDKMKTLSTSSNASDHVGTDMELSSPDVTYCNNNVTDIHQHTCLSQPAGSNTLSTAEKIVQSVDSTSSKDCILPVKSRDSDDEDNDVIRPVKYSAILNPTDAPVQPLLGEESDESGDEGKIQNESTNCRKEDADKSRAPHTSCDQELSKDTVSTSSKTDHNPPPVHGGVVSRESQRSTASNRSSRSVSALSNDSADVSWDSIEGYDIIEEPISRANRPASQSNRTSNVGAKVKNKIAAFRRHSSFDGIGVFDKLQRMTSRSSITIPDDETDTVLMKVTLDISKHPAPQLPPSPDCLTHQQLKRRHIVASLVDNENSYFNTLQRIHQDYQEALYDTRPQILSNKQINDIFQHLSEIEECHKMFNIELSDCVKNWDNQEKIGHVFTASFCKGMVFEAYSKYLNNFTCAMESIAKLEKQKSSFADFLQDRILSSPDKLPLVALMVRPVQRFPQFILLLQDLLRSTPQDHSDRLPLQMALTELENITHCLNETKRMNDDTHSVKKLAESLMGKHNVKHTPQRYLIKQDTVMQIIYSGNDYKSKERHLFLLNDQLVCTIPIVKNSDVNGPLKFRYKWSVNIKDISLSDGSSSNSPAYHIQDDMKQTVVSPKLDKSAYVPRKQELDDMYHDMALIERITQDVAQLRFQYKGLTTQYFADLTDTLLLAIRQQNDEDSNLLQITVPAKYLRLHGGANATNRWRFTDNGNIEHTFQMPTHAAKLEWMLELRNAKLALDIRNCPGWLVPESENLFKLRLPLFIKPLLVDILSQETKYCNSTKHKIQCGVCVLLPDCKSPALGTQHLWVCSHGDGVAQVNLFELSCNSEPMKVESFEVDDSGIICCELVPGHVTSYRHDHGFNDPCVWMVTERNSILVSPVVSDDRGAGQLIGTLKSSVCSMKYFDNHMFIGLTDGTLTVYNRDIDGVWNMSEPTILDLGYHPISSIIIVNTEIWAACGANINIISVTSHYHGHELVWNIKKTSKCLSQDGELIECMLTSGAGLIVSYHKSSVLGIYCLENFEHLQDINISSVIHKVLEDKILREEERQQTNQISITCMLSTRGMLWMGTNIGFILSLPLPRLGGVPKVKVRPYVSYHAHSGPIKFLLPIQGGLMPIPRVTRSTSRSFSQGSASRTCTLDSKSCTIDSRTFTIDEDFPAINEEKSPTSTMDRLNGNNQSNTLASMNSESSYKGLCLDNIPKDSLQNTPSQTLLRNKWLSNPELHHTYTDSVEDVSSLYVNLLNSEELKECMTRISAVSYRPENMYDNNATVRNGPSKYNTLPASRSNTLEEDVRDNEVFEEVSKENVDLPKITYCPPQPAQKERCKKGSSASKSLVVVSGGSGHVNWNKDMAVDFRYEDVCLLLWQHRI